MTNKKAYFNYEIIDKIDAGIVLEGNEVKSIIAGKCSFNDSFCIIQNGEIFLRSFYIAHYENGNYQTNELRERKLLLTKKQINKLAKAIKEKGLTIVPLNIFKNEKAKFKMTIGLARGKKNYDKRASIKERDIKRSLQ